MLPTNNPESPIKLNPWDSNTQQYHGGQEWAKLKTFVDDFSVTTNCFGTPKSGLDAVSKSVNHIHHYPSADQEPAKSDLARFIWPEFWAVNRNRLLLGNGASELIDLVIRLAPHGKWKPGPWDVQYMEYKRSAKTHKYTILNNQCNEPADLTCIVNPNNPTGEFMNVEKMKFWIQTNVNDNGVVVIDESMQPWHSAKWREESMTSQHAYIQDLLSSRNVQVYVIHSWTKIWCCTGLRIGSIITPSENHTQNLIQYQVPWSVNSLALKFLSAVVCDTTFLEQTWAHTTQYRNDQLIHLKQVSNSVAAKFKTQEWVFCGESFISWIWINVHSAKVADVLVHTAQIAGTPVRAGKYGYDQPTFVRVKVGLPDAFRVLIQAWMSTTLFD